MPCRNDRVTSPRCTVVSFGSAVSKRLAKHYSPRRKHTHGLRVGRHELAHVVQRFVSVFHLSPSQNACQYVAVGSGAITMLLAAALTGVALAVAARDCVRTPGIVFVLCSGISWNLLPGR
jgi:hypothetical protein